MVEEEDMEMVEEEEEMVVQVYDVVEVDLDYEYDAARFFDFTRPESEAEARLSEHWFHSAPNYPPSPFVAKLFPMEGLYSPNVSPKAKCYDGVPLGYDDAVMNQDSQHCYQNKGYRELKSQPAKTLDVGTLPSIHNQTKSLFGGQSMGFSFYNHTNELKKAKSKSLAKPYMPKSSTLMKPTASQLAKQNQRRQAVESRLHKSEDNPSSVCGIENQASKRQKLDGGVLRKIVDVKQPTNLIHKMPKKDVAVQGMNVQNKLRITIPREPDLETAHRAERIRYTSNKELDKTTAATSRYKARPFNRKIPEVPVLPVPKRSTPHLQEFQGSSKASAGRILGTGNRCDPVNAPKLAERQSAYSFKARPLDRKILASRGDLGVFRNNKRDVTVPKEFAFQTAKRNQQHPPVDLFSKLSLAGEHQPKSCAEVQLPQNCIDSKGSKENRWQSCRQDQNMKLQTRGTQDTPCEKQILSAANGAVDKLGLENGTPRNGAIWRQ